MKSNISDQVNGHVKIVTVLRTADHRTAPLKGIIKNIQEYSGFLNRQAETSECKHYTLMYSDVNI